MYDEMVFRAQQFINSAYGHVPDIAPVQEDGQTGWATMKALTRALQYELGISPRADAFGPTTLSTLQARWPSITSATTVPQGSVPTNVIYIIQSALYCKGYDGGSIDGTYNSRVSASIRTLKTDMGVDTVYPGDAVVPKVLKALLTMDAYVVVPGGTAAVRSVQQWMNATYVNRKDFFVNPCDGLYSRDVQKALMLALQFEAGMADGVANGVFGPGTQDALKAHVLSTGSSGPWVRLFSAAMLFNRCPGATFTATFDATLAAAVRRFQAFAKLPETGKGDFQTWASLLVSTGDPTRKGTACDCITEITDARAKALKAAGYQVIGRYLSNAPVANALNKEIRPGELGVIAANGLRAFPIYQTLGGAVGYFSRGQGNQDALAALDRVRYHGFKAGTTIYFAVDFDAMDQHVTDNVIPHFRGIKEVMDQYRGQYRIGVYAPRNVCSRLADAGLTTASFVSDMSRGFSGNLGYPLPEDWAFDQISTITVGSGNGTIEIDNNIASGRDAGQASFDPGERSRELDVEFDGDRLDTMDIPQRTRLLGEIQAYMESVGVPESGIPMGVDLGGLTVGSMAYRYSTTEAFAKVLSHDALVTRLARLLRIRKALIQVPLLWEMRHANALDDFADSGVRIYHGDGLDPDPTGKWTKRDGSTGLGQIFAATAIDAWNHMIRQGEISGTARDSSRDADLWEVWQKLNADESYNITTVAYVEIHCAAQLDNPRPGLDYSEEHTRQVFRRYQGSGDAAEEDSVKKLGLYRVFEKYNALERRVGTVLV